MTTALRTTSMTNSTRADAVAAPAPSIADPAPLGLAAFAATTLMLSAVNAHWIAQSSAPAVLAMALCYGGIIQVLAGMWEFRRGNTFGAVAFSSFGGFWLSFWAFNQFFAAGIPAGEVGDAVGMYLLVWAIFTTYMLVASLRVNVSVALVFLTLAVTYWLLMAGNYANSTNLIKIGGWVGALTAVLAFYASFAGVVNDSWKRTLLPVGPLAPAPAERSQSAERNAQAS